MTEKEGEKAFHLIGQLITISVTGSPFREWEFVELRNEGDEVVIVLNVKDRVDPPEDLG